VPTRLEPRQFAVVAVDVVVIVGHQVESPGCLRRHSDGLGETFEVVYVKKHRKHGDQPAKRLRDEDGRRYSTPAPTSRTRSRAVVREETWLGRCG
jgi:hypothetical protein